MKRMQGFSLVELMIGMVLGLLIIAAAASVFLGSRAGYGTTTGVSALTDNARFASQFLAQGLRSTGFIGCVGSVANHSLNPQQSLVTMDSVNFGATGPYPPAIDFVDLLSGYVANGTSPGNSVTISSTSVSWDSGAADWSPALPTSAFQPVAYNGASGSPGTGLSSVKYSDILVVHNTVPPSIAPDLPAYLPLGIPPPPSAANFTVTSTQINNGANGLPVESIVAGDIVVISNCLSSGYVFTVGAVSGTQITPSDSAAFAQTQYGAGSQLSIPTTSVFFLGVGEDGDSALWRADYNMVPPYNGPMQLSATELVPDVENMQILYGVDIATSTTPNFAVSTYYTADQVATNANFVTDIYYPVPAPPATAVLGWNTVQSVRVGLLVASPPNAAPLPSAAQTYSVLGTNVTVAPDTRLRQVYEFTVTNRNDLN